ncbi:MAG TPA: phosphatase PAP2 family protein [Xanthomonadaceae bacterium]|jgi:undecaprenyl-diphosphatase
MAEGGHFPESPATRASARRDPRAWLCVLSLALFVVLAAMLKAGLPFAFDRPIQLAAHSLSNHALDRVARFLAYVGYGIGVIPFDVLFVVALAVRKRTRDAIFALTALGGSLWLDEVMKTGFARPRPTLWAASEIQHGFGFPSGHAMAVATLAAVVALLARPGRLRWPICVALAAFALVVGVSRVYVGVHYPSDVLAGWCAGIAWATGLHKVFFRAQRGGRRLAPSG